MPSIGSVAVDTDENGNIMQVVDYYPYGSVRIDEQTDAYSNDYKFTGKELDESTDQYYFEARYYNPTLHRFTSQDPVFRTLGSSAQLQALTGKPQEYFLADPQQLHSYSYARNNPIIYTDPTGMLSWRGTARATYKAISKTVRSIQKWAGSLGSITYTKQSTISRPSVNSAQNSIKAPTIKTTTWDSVTDRRIRELDPRVQQPATNFINNTESQLGIQLRVTDGYRSIQEQNDIYNRGVRPAAPGGYSYHNYRRAIDVAVVENGKPYARPVTEEIAKIGEAQGFEWGGMWLDPDPPHFEMSFGQSTEELYKNYLKALGL